MNFNRLNQYLLLIKNVVTRIGILLKKIGEEKSNYTKAVSKKENNILGDPSLRRSSLIGMLT